MCNIPLTPLTAVCSNVYYWIHTSLLHTLNQSCLLYASPSLSVWTPLFSKPPSGLTVCQRCCHHDKKQNSHISHRTWNAANHNEKRKKKERLKDANKVKLPEVQLCLCEVRRHEQLLRLRVWLRLCAHPRYEQYIHLSVHPPLSLSLAPLFSSTPPEDATRTRPLLWTIKLVLSYSLVQIQTVTWVKQSFLSNLCGYVSNP